MRTKDNGDHEAGAVRTGGGPGRLTSGRHGARLRRLGCNRGTHEGHWRSCASYEAIEASLREIRRQADVEGITSIAIPRNGVGYGGLSWKKVRAIVESAFNDWAGTLVVYGDYVPKESANPG